MRTYNRWNKLKSPKDFIKLKNGFFANHNRYGKSSEQNSSAVRYTKAALDKASQQFRNSVIDLGQMTDVPGPERSHTCHLMGKEISWEGKRSIWFFVEFETEKEALTVWKDVVGDKIVVNNDASKDVDYGELYFKMDKYLPEDNDDAVEEYYEIVESNDSSEEKIKRLVDFFQTYGNSTIMEIYMPDWGTLNGFAEYITNLYKTIVS